MDIIKKSNAGTMRPNLLDFADESRRFSWAKARQQLDGLPDQRGLNAAHEAVDRRCRGEHSNHTAIRWLGAGAVLRGPRSEERRVGKECA